MLNFAGQKYREFVKFQNLIDSAYIQIVTGEKLLPESLEDLMTLNWVSILTASKKIEDLRDLTDQMSISPVFYTQLFRKKVLIAVFLHF
jgi:hypothetical protein